MEPKKKTKEKEKKPDREKREEREISLGQRDLSDPQ